MATGSSEGITAEKRHSAPVNFLLRLVREKPLGTAGAVITFLLLFTGVFADLLAPHGYNELFTADMLRPPSAEYLLGTDNTGRDLLSRIIYGARISVIVGLVGTTLATVLSVTIGMMSGYIGGRFDLLMQRFVDSWMCFPGLILLMMMMSILGPGMWSIIIVLGIQWGITGSRIIRGAEIAIKENAYVKAARAIGCPTSKVLIRHILPNIMAPIIILFSTRVPTIIVTEASLSFLGLGIPPPHPSWGGMLSGAGRAYMFLAPWLAIWPGLALSIVVYGINMFGDAVRDILDPRLRGGSGRYDSGMKKKALRESKPEVTKAEAKLEKQLAELQQKKRAKKGG